MPLNAHIMVVVQAREMANEWFEVFMHENDLWRAMRERGAISEQKACHAERAARRLFVNRIAPKFYEQAREALAAMLEQPDDKVPISQKDAIADALILDNDLRGNRLVAKSKATLPKHLH